MRRVARWAMYLGTLVVVVAVSLYHARVVADPPYDYTGTFRFGWSLVYIALLCIAAYAVGLPELARGPRSALASSVAATAGAAIAISGVQLFVGDALLPRVVVFGSAIILVPWYVLCAAWGTDAKARSASRDRVVVVGDDHEIGELRQEMGRSPERSASLAAVVAIADAAGEGTGGRPLLDIVAKSSATVIVLDRTAQGEPLVVAQVAELHETGLRVRTLSLFYEEWLGMLPVSELERVSLLFDIGEVHRLRYGRIKRVVDIVIAAIGTVVLALLLPFVLVGNLLGNRGPLFFRQERVGKNGELFDIVKLRTMRPPDRGELANEWTRKDDPRITAFGGFLRRTHLDELPQTINILRGDLSVVGPRPEQPQYVAELKEKLPFYDLRHLVRPGLTGWAQVKYGYAGDERDALEKLQYEFWYLRHQSLRLDLRTLGRTVRSVLGGSGRGR